jgi:thioredoxin reductase (NADPH)
MPIYDLIIIGAGPAGLSAAIYAARYKMNFLVVGELVGGLATEAHKVSNYPGVKDISGIELMESFRAQAEALGAKIEESAVQNIEKKKDRFVVKTANASHEAKAIILALGLQHRKLNISGEEEFLGKGVSYCATCDGAFYKNKNVAVIGGGNSAVSAAVMLAKIAKKVYLINRSDKFRAEPAWIEELKKMKNAEIIYNANVSKVSGKEFVEKIELDTGKKLDVDGLFIEAGVIPSTLLAKNLVVSLDENGFISVDNEMNTNVAGVFAAGDITNGSSFKQIVIACGQGAIAAYSAYKFVAKNK